MKEMKALVADTHEGDSQVRWGRGKRKENISYMRFSPHHILRERKIYILCAFHLTIVHRSRAADGNGARGQACSAACTRRSDDPAGGRPPPRTCVVPAWLRQPLEGTITIQIGKNRLKGFFHEFIEIVLGLLRWGIFILSMFFLFILCFHSDVCPHSLLGCSAVDGEQLRPSSRHTHINKILPYSPPSHTHARNITHTHMHTTPTLSCMDR